MEIEQTNANEKRKTNKYKFRIGKQNLAFICLRFTSLWDSLKYICGAVKQVSFSELRYRIYGSSLVKI